MTLTLVVAAALTAADGELAGVAIHAPDGNTVIVRPEAGKAVVVRLIGLDAPRKATRDATGQEPWGTRAQQFLALKVARKPVRVEYDLLRPASAEGNTLWGYVWLGDKLINEEVLKAGHAVLDTRPPNVRYAERLQAASREAREKGRGVWDPAGPLPEPPGKFVARKQAAEEKRAEVQAGLALEEFAAGCVVANSKTKKYHEPGGRYYEQSKASKNAVFFRTPEDARASGYTPSAR